MSRLVLVRHGQASFLEPDYDKLSALGETQSHLLGEFWASRDVKFDHTATGPLSRQRNTARIVAEAYRRAGVRFPEPIPVPEFNECDAESVLRDSLPKLIQTDEQVRALNAAIGGSATPEERSKNFQRLFETVIGRWVSGELPVPGVELWAEFRARVNRGISAFMARCGHGATAAVFTSGGPIAVAVERALHLRPLDTLRIMWMSRNCSYSEFLFSGERFTLSAFNATPHLDGAKLVTYR
ncbi:MAG TPA: histidine phosphatase family protein [Candidatus Acidoferrales bacterium]|nr:histidine phosphatase family protein [Candidatus Acidoferrales bacterium]